MKVAFTICANNYLAFAKVLKDSFAEHHPDITFHIILVDKSDVGINYQEFCEDNILFVDDIIDLDIENLSLQFHISELCTTVKPFVFRYLLKQYTKAVYIDPDIKIYAPLQECWQALDKYSFVLTPHLITPIDDDKIPTDFITLRTGIFNLGFLGLSHSNVIESFLTWWGDRVLKYGYCRMSEGMFFDQVWMNYIPVMYDNYYIIKHLGYNVANWNWHERYLSYSDNVWLVNGTYPLVFFHFSSFKYSQPSVLCVYNTRYSKDNRPDLVPLFEEYYNNLTDAGFVISGKTTSYYSDQFNKHQRTIKAFESKILYRIKKKLIRLIEKTL
jgi:hypothetical protein